MGIKLLLLAGFAALLWWATKPIRQSRSNVNEVKLLQCSHCQTYYEKEHGCSCQKEKK